MPKISKIGITCHIEMEKQYFQSSKTKCLAKRTETVFGVRPNLYQDDGFKWSKMLTEGFC